jgi:hypothetical protein
MQDRLSELLREDHIALSAALERAPLTDAVLSRLARYQRRERIALGLAVLVGLGLAAWQLPALRFLHLTTFGLAVRDLSLLGGTLVIAATAAVFGWSLSER